MLDNITNDAIRSTGNLKWCTPVLTWERSAAHIQPPQLKASSSSFLTWPDLQPVGLCPCSEPPRKPLCSPPSSLPHGKEVEAVIHQSSDGTTLKTAHGHLPTGHAGSQRPGLPHHDLCDPCPQRPVSRRGPGFCQGCTAFVFKDSLAISPE